ncbi:MAG TPA: DNA polymerase III subunit delta [Cycloclasticus sp.]|jgi:DNA polymerase-3 subunit delta|nr:DNA polymerase III subunit delta [Cycloclasticus sp.]HIL91289.1 DNA polymerase III subunit delta [Cycloclasticus sp.]
MQLDVNKLSFSVDKGLAAVYLITGDEPLQQGEAVDLIRKKARLDGFLNREVLHVDGRFDWNQLLGVCLTQSLFAEKNLIELNLPTGKPGRDGSQAIEKVISDLSADNVLIIIAGKLDKASKNTKWFKSVDKHGVVVQVWPLFENQLYGWLKLRLNRKGMTTDQQSIKLLADSVEGNLLAAVQEIEKLHAIHGAAQLSASDIVNAVADNARYDVFKLTDSLLAGNSVRTVQVLKGLLGEKLAAPVILWALMRELRIMAGLSFEKASTGRTAGTFKKHRVWDSKQSQYMRALSRGSVRQWQGLIQACAKAERMTKGVDQGNEWLLIEQICLAFCEPKRLKQYGIIE